MNGDPRAGIVARFIACLSDPEDRVDEAGALLAPGAVFVEHPNAINPRGSVRDRDTMLRSAREGRSMLVRQRYDVRARHVDGDWVVMRTTWTGTLARATGPLAAGAELRAQVAQFFLVEDGLISRIESFDCYDPLGEPFA